MPTDTLTPAYQTPKIENETVDVAAIEPNVKTDFEENASHQEGIIHDLY